MPDDIEPESTTDDSSSPDVEQLDQAQPVGKHNARRRRRVANKLARRQQQQQA